MFDHPHRYLTEDLAFAREHFGLDEQACRARFLDALRCGAVCFDGRPVYLFCVGPGEIINTACEARLDRFVRPLTRESIRFIRSHRAMFAGTWGFIDQADIQSGSVRALWLKAIGYTPIDTVEAYGQTFQRFQFQG